MIFSNRPTKAEMEAFIRAAGMNRRFKPFAEDNGGVWAMLLECRKPARIVSGELEGTEAAFYDRSFRVWTSRTALAARLIREHGLAGHSREGEAEVVVPAPLADDILPRFGVKVRREVTEAQRERGRMLLKSLKTARTIGKTGVFGT